MGLPRRLAMLVLPLAIALAACRTTPQNPGAGGDTLTIVNLNIYHDKDDWPKRRALIVEALRQSHPDVIALEEVLQHAGLQNDALQNQAEFLGAALGYRVHFVSVDPPGAGKRYGNAVLTRHRMLASGERRLRPSGDSRIAVFVRIDFNGRPVDIYATHLHHSAEGAALRTQQARDLADFIAQTRGNDAAVLVGDFNTTADAAELEPLRAAGFIDSYGTLHPEAAREPAAHATLNRRYFPDDRRRIDHIFYASGAFQPLASRIILDQPDAAGTWASDHYGLLTTLRLLPRAPH